MRKEQQLLKSFLRKQIYAYRINNHHSQERMSENLGISTRSYVDQEHGKMGFSALSLMYFILLLDEQEIIKFLKDFKVFCEKNGDDAA